MNSLVSQRQRSKDEAVSTIPASGMGLRGWLQHIAWGRINPPNAKKPASLVYGVDDDPPAAVVLTNAIQQIAIIAINLVYPIVVFRAAGASVDITSGLLAVAMIVLAFGTFLQVLRLGPSARAICAHQHLPRPISLRACWRRGSAAFRLFLA